MSSRGKKKKEYRKQLLRQLLIEREQRLNQMEADLAREMEEITTVYLDTNHWVNLRHCVLGSARAKAEYYEILKLLERLIAQKRIVCPLSAPIFQELMKQSDEMTRRETAKLMDRLSGRTCLQFPLLLILSEWRHNVWQVMLHRKERCDFPVWTKAGFWAGQQLVLKDVEFWSVRNVSDIDRWIDNMWSRGFEQLQAMPGHEHDPPELIASFIEEINNVTARSKAKTKSFEENCKAERLGLLNSLKEEFFNEPLPMKGIPPIEIFTSFVDGDNDWTLASLQVFAKIASAIVQSNRKTEEHDMYDFLHAAGALVYCDVFFCDNPMANFFVSKPLEFNKVYKTIIVSRPVEIIDYLKGLICE